MRNHFHCGLNLCFHIKTFPSFSIFVPEVSGFDMALTFKLVLVHSLKLATLISSQSHSQHSLNSSRHFEKCFFNPNMFRALACSFWTCEAFFKTKWDAFLKRIWSFHLWPISYVQSHHTRSYISHIQRGMYPIWNRCWNYLAILLHCACNNMILSNFFVIKFQSSFQR